MNTSKIVCLAAGVIAAAALAHGNGISFTCAPDVDAAVAGTCNYLNSIIASQYSSTFSNANAVIYVQYGTTALASSTTGFDNQVTYGNYVAALTANASKDGIDISALAALASFDNTPYGGGNVDLTSALASALGISGEVIGGIAGTTATGVSCDTPGVSGCYNGIITMSNAPGTWFFDNSVGPELSTQYDFYGALEHETDELLGTSSCISTMQSPLIDNCPGVSTPSAADLFRYSSAGQLVLDSSLSTTPGAYFSYNGGATNGANGIGGSPKFYNTLDNGDDYADFVSSSPNCATNQAVQDAEGCAGADTGVFITNDGGAEINILNAVGYDLLNPGPSTPEPSTLALLGVSLAFLAFFVRRARV